MRRGFCTLSLLAALTLFVSGPLQAQSHFLRGDVNSDQAVDLGDAIFTLNFLFVSGSPNPVCMDAADINDDGSVNIADAISLLGFLFQNGAPPAAPYPIFEADPTPDSLSCKPNEVILTGDITSDMTLSFENTYRLVSGVFVQAGATLTIPPGVTLLGDTASQGLLVAERGAQINAVGTSKYPVVFTSEQPVGMRARGDWGGVILLGNAIVNLPGSEGLAEGLNGDLFGGGANADNTDSSGHLSYVRIEFGGTEISLDNEVNSLSIFGCGSGTQLDHLQAKFNLDDGFEWFGGAADLKYGVCFCNEDDNYDYSFGWVGHGQFWVAQQRGDACDHGFEVDNSESDYGAVPFTDPTISNVTLIGDPSPGSASTSGILLRRGTGSVIYNTIVQGFPEAGLDLDDPETTTHNPTNGDLIVDYCAFYDNGEPYETTDVETGPGWNFTTLEFGQDLNPNNTILTSSPVEDPYNLDNPNFRTVAAVAPAPLDPTTLGPFFDPADYIGAVPPAGEGADWTHEGWISYQQN